MFTYIFYVNYPRNYRASKLSLKLNNGCFNIYTPDLYAFTNTNMNFLQTFIFSINDDLIHQDKQVTMNPDDN